MFLFLAYKFSFQLLIKALLGLWFQFGLIWLSPVSFRFAPHLFHICSFFVGFQYPTRVFGLSIWCCSCFVHQTIHTILYVFVYYTSLWRQAIGFLMLITLQMAHSILPLLCDRLNTKSNWNDFACLHSDSNWVRVNSVFIMFTLYTHTRAHSPSERDGECFSAFVLRQSFAFATNKQIGSMQMDVCMLVSFGSI